MRGHADAAEVDVVEVAERNAVEHEHLGCELEVLLENGADRLRHVAVEEEVNRLALLYRARQRELDRARKRAQALVGGLAAPAERERHFRLPFGNVESGEMLANRLGERIGGDRFL